ncbi:MAG: AMP-binding protein [Deltaproteobacteria bacterium]|nr:AMP-binding protein [Deltaproteobacteria bacterium]
MEINTLGDLLKNSAQQFGSSPALGFVGETMLTYADVARKAAAVIALLEKNGIQSGDKVAILSSNQPNWGIAFFAIAAMGAVVVPILPDFTDSEIENVLSHSEAKAVFVSESLYRKISNSCLETLKLRVVVEQFAVVPGGTAAADIAGLPSALNDDAVPEKEYPVDKHDLASLIYTSGTTGKSKGVMLTHHNLIFTAKMSGRIHPVDTTDSMLSVLPLSHTYENTIGFIFPMMYGSSISYLRKPPVASVLIAALQQVKPTLMLTVPLIIEKIYKGKILPAFNAKALTRILYTFPPARKLLSRIAAKKLMQTFGGRLKFFGIGGAKLDPEVERFLIEGKFPYAVGYGLTETSPLLAGFDAFCGKHQSTGLPMPGVTLKINNPDPVTGQGEVWARGENVMLGYYKEPELTKEVLTEDGWFKTGDLGCFDTAGFLFLKGRVKNMIVGPSGENIYPEEIEEIINRFKHVLESVVVQQKGKLVALVHFNMEELQATYQHLKDQAAGFIDKHIEELTKELHVYVNARVNKFSRIQKVVSHLEPFKKTATKKIKRFLYH